MMLPVLAWLLLSPASAERDIWVEIHVIDEGGQPLRTGRIVPDGDRSRHVVEADRGMWVETHRRVGDGEFRPLQTGELYTAWVSAPGYRAHHVQAVLASPSTPLTVQLEPLKAPALGCLPTGKTFAGNGEELALWATHQLEQVRHDYEGQAYVERVSCLRAVLAVSWSLRWQRLDTERAGGREDADHLRADYVAWGRAKSYTAEWLEWNRHADLPLQMATQWCDAAHSRPCR